MNISGFQKLSLLDFPGKLGCIIFTQGCNYKCSFCQNSDLIHHNDDYLISEDEVIKYLIKRRNILDGLVISGGEPTIQKNLKRFCQRVKSETKLAIKLDTNGSNPKVVKELIDEHLIDYVAMDIKNIFDEYGIITQIPNIKIENIKESIELLKQGQIDYEFRTTIMKNYHNITKLKKICKYLGKESKYYIQNFEDSEAVLDKSLISFSKEELKEIEVKLKKKFPNVKVRGI